MDSSETYFGSRIDRTWVEYEPISSSRNGWVGIAFIELGKIGRGQRYFRWNQAKDLYISCLQCPRDIQVQIGSGPWDK